VHGRESKVLTRYVRIPAHGDYADPLTFPLYDYPAYVSKPFEVRIK